MAEDGQAFLRRLDPKNLIRESFAIDGIGMAECRSIFLDWALSLPDGLDQVAACRDLLSYYAPAAKSAAQAHPMVTVLLQAAQAQPTPARRRGGRAARLGEQG